VGEGEDAGGTVSSLFSFFFSSPLEKKKEKKGRRGKMKYGKRNDTLPHYYIF